MSDIQKLHKVIESLEEQSSKVNEFSGVLNAVNSAKSEIVSARSEFALLGDEYKKLVSQSSSRFDEYGQILSGLEERITSIEENLITKDQFDVGVEKILHQVSDLDFVTPELLEASMISSEKNTAALISENTNKLHDVLEKQQSTIETLRSLMIVGTLTLGSIIAFLIVLAQV